MSRWIHWASVSVLLFGLAAQDSKDENILLGRPVALRLGGGEKKSAKIPAHAGDYLRIEVQAGADLAVKTTLFDESGKLVAVTPSLGGTGGVARIAALAESSGQFRLDVQSPMFRPDPLTATVTLTVQRPATAEDRTDAEAHREFATAAALANSGAAGMRQAIGALERPIELARRAGDLVLEMRATFGVGQFYGTLGEMDGSLEGFQKAIAPFERALELCRKFGDARAESHVLSSLGQTYANLERNREAVEWYGKALELQRTTKQSWETALTLNNLAVAEAGLGRLDLALDYLREQEILRAQLKDELGLNQMRVSLADTYLALGDFEHALESLAATLPHWAKLDDPATEADAYGKLGLAYMSTGEYDAAGTALRKAVALGEKLHNTKTTSNNLLLLAQLAGLRRDAAGAMKAYEVALKAARDGGYRRNECLALAGWSGLEHLRAALAIAEELSQPYDRANVQRLMGEAHASMGDAETAAREFEAALETERRLGDRFGEVQTLADLAALDEKAGRVGRSLARLGEAMDAIDATRSSLAEPGLRAAFLASQRSVYERAASLYERTGLKQRAFEVSERAHARALLDLVGKDTNDVDPALRALDSALHTAAVQGKQARVAELLAERKQVELRLGQKTEASASLGLDAIRSRLVTGDVVLLEYLTGKREGHLWVVTASDLRHYSLPGEAALEASARRLYEAVTVRKNGAAEAAELAKVLLPMPAAMLAGRRVAMVVDGPLQLVPFAMLLPETARVTEAPSASVLARLRGYGARRPLGRVLVLADPVYSASDPRVDAAYRKAEPAGARDTNSALLRSANDFAPGGFERLRMSRAEADEIGKVMPATALTGFDATPAALRRADLDRFGVIHVAAHTLLDNAHPELSGLVLSLVDRQGRPRDGFLRLFDVYEMRLRSELVVLSACETSIGRETRGEGMIGLSRGFLAAGSRRVLASLWKVDDRATAEFMRYFYGALAKGASPSDAVGAARKALRADAAWRSGFYWGAFVLQGDW